jgi:glycosyltransferase involved in cell wall biosynthesis
VEGTTSSHGSNIKPMLKVRTDKGHSASFVVKLGQRNTEFVSGPVSPLRRIWPWAGAFCILEPGADVIHTINAVPLFPKRPYILTFEDYLPRLPRDGRGKWIEARLIRHLLSHRCVAILAMSQYALRQFEQQNRHHPFYRALKAKIELLYPAVSVRRTTPKKASTKLRLLTVGADFMRKGVPVVVRAHERLVRAGVPVDTTIVSSLQWAGDDYIGPPDEALVKTEIKRIAQEGITHLGLIDNSRVLQLMEAADYFIFPTFHDTFGYVSIEALSCGTPVIASNTCAQPEIVSDGECGYLLPLENDDDVGKWIWADRNREDGYVEAYQAAVESLADALTQSLLACWEARADYERLSAGALARIRERFDRDRARDRLEALYARCATYRPAKRSTSRS